MASHPEFGLGLVSLGRTWAYRPSPLPSRAQTKQLLTAAVKNRGRIMASVRLEMH
jgi:hypothetical protein